MLLHNIYNFNVGKYNTNIDENIIIAKQTNKDLQSSYYINKLFATM